MQDVNHMLMVLGDALGIKGLAFNGDGQAEIVYPNGLSIYITRMEDRIAEMSLRLPDLDAADPGMMKAMLEANCLGSGTGNGRLGLDAASGEAIYCERWDVSAMDARDMEQRFAELLEHCTFWLTEGTDLIVNRARPNSAEGISDGSENLLRV